MESERQPTARLDGDTATTPAKSLHEETAEQCALARWDEVEKSITRATDLSEVLDWRNKVEAIRTYVTIGQRVSIKEVNRLTRWRMICERKIGGMLAEMPKQHGARPDDTEWQDANQQAERWSMMTTASLRGLRPLGCRCQPRSAG